MNDENKKILQTTSYEFDVKASAVLDELIKQEAEKIEFTYSNNLQNNLEKNNKKMKFSGLSLIPKYKEYLRYIINLLQDLPRTEKFNFVACSNIIVEILYLKGYLQ